MSNGKGDARRRSSVSDAEYADNYRRAFGREKDVIISDDGLISMAAASLPFSFDDQFAVSDRALNGYNGWLNANPDQFSITSNRVINAADVATFLGDAGHDMPGLDVTKTWRTDFFITISSIAGQLVSKFTLSFASDTLTAEFDFLSGNFLFTSNLDSVSGPFTPNIGGENKYSVQYDASVGQWKLYNNDVLLGSIVNDDPVPGDTFIGWLYRGQSLPSGRFSTRRVTVNGTQA